MANLIKIDRFNPFDPKVYMGTSWSIVEQDSRSLAIDVIELDKIELDPILKDGETFVTGGVKLNRLKNDGRIRLDAKVSLTIWENRKIIPEDWKKYRIITFDGTILRSLHGESFIPCLSWDDVKWRWGTRWFRDGFGCGVSALLRGTV